MIGEMSEMKNERFEIFSERYTNADMKIFRYICVHIKIICIRFITAFTF